MHGVALPSSMDNMTPRLASMTRNGSTDSCFSGRKLTCAISPSTTTPTLKERETFSRMTPFHLEPRYANGTKWTACSSSVALVGRADGAE
eukprot:CAMPEP_0181244818 /NCGR_PEP_ID=MMETSP1096-20121128/43075_1 /TAXON_ID=156174 ORGANISM="Chrysochromulina ericina, Strain CCMP281" /NCGR_SAMPLE_ID=MMETSP1096 /ASSEMBLY_ACC=CAM_ASM_000453 /LENGTH=89 /DNA_ID=CAMNT_0023341417 /DNA_START=903 /DNA_END=1169 /DNA_ORIENTATION=-